jgi:hypothetical protein
LLLRFLKLLRALTDTMGTWLEIGNLVSYAHTWEANHDNGHNRTLVAAANFLFLGTQDQLLTYAQSVYDAPYHLGYH